MNATHSPDALNAFFAGAPRVIGIVIYLTSSSPSATK